MKRCDAIIALIDRCLAECELDGRRREIDHAAETPWWRIQPLGPPGGFRAAPLGG